MTIDLPAELEAALKAHASAQGLSVERFVRQIVERQIRESQPGTAPFKTGRGAFAQYGLAPSSQEIETNRAEIFARFGETFL
jgi:plasmid stability protein